MSRPTSRRFTSSLYWTTAALILLVACRDTPAVVPESDTGPLVADSTGVRVVVDSVPAWGGTPRWTVSDSPSVDLGAPAELFVGIAPVVRMADGRIVVADGARQTIFFFDASGKLLTSAGGRGSDEDQFHGLGWIGRGPGDTLVAFDFITRRLSLFDGKGKYVRGTRLLPADPNVAADPLASYPDGSVLFRLGKPANPFPGAPGAVVRDSAAYMRFGLDGLPRTSLGIFPQSESFGVLVRPKGPPSPFPVPYGLVTVAGLRADTMLIGTGASFEIASIDPDGKTVGLLRVDIPREPVTPEESAEYTKAAVTRLRSGALSLKTPLDSSVIRAVEKAPFPARKPAFGRLLVDRTGALWISAPRSTPNAGSTWTVFAPDGTWLGTVTTPDGLRIDEIGADYLLGVFRARHGEERVRVYPLTRGGGS